MLRVIHHAELTSVGTDDVVIVVITDPGDVCSTRIGDDVITTEGPYHFAIARGLEPATTYPLQVEGAPSGEFLPETVATLARPSGAFRSAFATVNDVHFGEEECGRWESDPAVGPILRSAPGEPPYPETMNRGAIAEMLPRDLAAVLVKGDLTERGTAEEFAQFRDAYGVFGERLHFIAGNHDVVTDAEIMRNGAPFVVSVPGATLAMLHTAWPGHENGRLADDQVEWLDALAAEATDPVLVFGHHHLWDPASADRNDDYFGVIPDDSEQLVEVFARRPAIAGYFSGHTHRNRVRRFAAVPRIPIVEVACTKDYPGMWAEYRIYEGGYTQQVHRIQAPEAMGWTERTRELFFGLYRDYALGGIADRCFTQTVG